MSYRRFTVIVAVLLTLAITGISSGQVATGWIKRYDGPAHMADKPSAIGLDSSGNVIVTGSSVGLNGQSNYATIKYDSAGALQWIKRSNAPGSARALAVDAFGNIYVAGHSAGNFLTIKYDSAGNEVWTRQYDGGTGYTDSACAVAIGDDGSVFVSGSSTPPQGHSDYLTVKYNSAGDLLWALRYDGPCGKSDEVKAIAVDNLGNVCVTGRSVGENGGYDLATVKYDINGEEFWVKRYAGAPNRLDQGEAIAVDQFRNVYVAGTSRGENGNDYLVIKYDNYGEELWMQRYDAPSHGDDCAKAIAVDSLGSVYVAGWSHVSGAGDDLTLVRYDATGEFHWASRYNGQVNGEDRACAIAVDAFGKIYVAGSSTGSDNSLNQLTLKFDTNGERLWAQSFKGRGQSEDRAVALALDSPSNVYVTGTTQPPGEAANYLTVKYVQPPLWEKSTFTTPYGYTPEIAVDGTGRPHICYKDFPEEGKPLLRYAFFDGARWKKTIVDPNEANDYSMAIDSSDHVHISYCDSSNLKYAYFDGISWKTSIVDGRVVSTSITVDAQNRPHISYLYIEDSYPCVLKYAHHDGTQWIRETIRSDLFGGPLWFGGTSLALTRSGKANITVSNGDLPQQLYWVTNSSGDWIASRIAAGRQASLAMDSSDRPHVVYYKEGEGRVDYARYDGVRWITRNLHQALGIEGYADNARIEIDAAGVIHATFSLDSRYARTLIHAYKGNRDWAYDMVDADTSNIPIACHGKAIHLVYRKFVLTNGEITEVVMHHARSVR